MADWAEAARPLRMGGRGRTCRDLWDAAPQGDWLLWYAEHAGAPRRALVRAAAACVRPALRFVPERKRRPRPFVEAVEAAEAWVDDPTEGNRQRAEKAALAAIEKVKEGRPTSPMSAAELRAARTRTGARAWRRAEDAKWSAGTAAIEAVSTVAGAAAEAEGEGGWLMAGEAAGLASYANERAEGPESESAANAACAAEVRRLVPFLDLAGR